MAETVKKAKAPAKPRKAAAKKTPILIDAKRSSASHEPNVSREEIARLAHQYWAERGHQHGKAEEDWYRAEQELREKAS